MWELIGRAIRSENHNICWSVLLHDYVEITTKCIECDFVFYVGMKYFFIISTIILF